MVVSEAKIVFGLSDVVNVRLRCQSCGNEVVFKAGSKTRPTITNHCPLCNAEWLSRLGAESIQRTLRGIEEVDDFGANSVEVRIEIDAPHGGG